MLCYRCVRPILPRSVNRVDCVTSSPNAVTAPISLEAFPLSALVDIR
jgi:hypothetical protein